jgi:hypothetical protein
LSGSAGDPPAARPSVPIGGPALTAVLLAGLAGAVAMIPPGLALSAAGFEVNRYGVLLAQQLTGTPGRPALLVLLVLHLIIGMVSAVPLGLWWRARGVPGPTGRWVTGATYGGAYWLAVNALLLPTLYGRPFPWSEGAGSVWPSLVVHLLYGSVTAVVLGRLSAGRPT